MVSLVSKLWALKRVAFAATACVSALLLSSACHAPGRPEGEEAQPENATDFATLYNTNCAGCHGVDGKNGPGSFFII